MKDTSHLEWHRLFSAALNGTLTETETQQLATLLKSSAEARQLWFLYHDNECGLAELNRSATTAAGHVTVNAGNVSRSQPTTFWRQWRSLTSAAAGLALGLLGATVVFGLVVHRGSERRMPLAVHEPSFENATMPLASGFPAALARWGGDVARVVTAEGGVTPKEGKLMLRLEPLAQGVPRIYQVLDLQSLPPASAGESREIEFSASFAAADSQSPVRYVVRAFAITDAPESLEATWFDRREEAIASATGGMDVLPRTKGWRTMGVKIQAPPAARSLVLFLGVRTPDKAARTVPHYIDDVHVAWVMPATMP